MEGEVKDALELLDKRVKELEKKVLTLLHTNKEAQGLLKWLEDFELEVVKLKRT